MCASLLASGAAALATDTSVATAANPESNPQASWVGCSPSFAPLSDAAAAALVTHQAENRPSNVAANDYVPTSGQLQTFEGAKDTYNLTPSQQNPYDTFVDGRDGLSSPSTDDLIQWAAHKWGIPEDWLRAEYALESRWSQQGLGDQVTESASDYAANPGMSKIYGTSDVFRSLGITQEGWFPDGHLGAGTEPLRWESTAFNIDYQAAQVRFYYDDPGGVRDTWGDSTYVSCQQWNSIGGWFNPYPWNNSGQQNYVNTVQSYLSQSFWTTSDFNNTAPPSQPAGLSASVVNATDVHLSWNASSGGATGYELFRNGSTQPMFAPISGTAMDDTSVSSGNSYAYQVAAVDDNGNLSGKASVSVSDGASNVTPTPPPATAPPVARASQTPFPTVATTPSATPTSTVMPASGQPSPAVPTATPVLAVTNLPNTGTRAKAGEPSSESAWLAVAGLGILSAAGLWVARRPTYPR